MPPHPRWANASPPSGGITRMASSVLRLPASVGAILSLFSATLPGPSGGRRHCSRHGPACPQLSPASTFVTSGISSACSDWTHPGSAPGQPPSATAAASCLRPTARAKARPPATAGLCRQHQGRGDSAGPASLDYKSRIPALSQAFLQHLTLPDTLGPAHLSLLLPQEATGATPSRL